jgi:DNA-binding LacI/PurR family transcriptional regulator
MNDTRKKPTYEEISQRTGLSPATISRVLNHTANVSDATREKVFGAVASMGFDVSRMSKAKEHKSALLLLNIPSFNNPFTPGSLTERRIRRRGTDIRCWSAKCAG